MTRRAPQAVLWILAGLTFIITLSPLWADDDDDQVKEALWLRDRAKLVQKVNTLVIGDVNLKDVTVDQALNFLRQQTKLSDPDHQGINFARENQPELNALKISIKIKHATVENVLDQIPMVRADIGDFVVTLGIQGDEEMWSRTFHVRDNLLAINPSTLIDKDKQLYDVRSLFNAKGIPFPPGTSAVYDLPKKTLTVILDDPEDIIRVDELLVFGFKNGK